MVWFWYSNNMYPAKNYKFYLEISNFVITTDLKCVLHDHKCIQVECNNGQNCLLQTFSSQSGEDFRSIIICQNMRVADFIFQG